MSWAEGEYTFPEKTSESKIYSEIYESLERERGYYEPHHQKLCLLKDVPVFRTKDEAKEYIRDNSNKYYRKVDVGVRYIDYSNVKPTKAMLDLKRRINETVQKKEKYEEEHSIASFKSKFIGCPTCQSKLNKTFLTGNKCPLCHSELRSETTLTTISNYLLKIKNLEKEYHCIEKEQYKKGKVYWLVSAQCYIG